MTLPIAGTLSDVPSIYSPWRKFLRRGWHPLSTPPPSLGQLYSRNLPSAKYRYGALLDYSFLFLDNS